LEADLINPRFQSEEVYPPDEDTFLLLEAAIREARPEDHVLEVGCGSGLVSQELAGRVKSITALDINPHATRAARERGVEVVRADLFRGIRGRFDLIVFNPPYLPTEPEERGDQWINYALDGGASGRETIGRFLLDLADHLRPGGRALLLISSLTGPEEVEGMARDAELVAELVASKGCFFERLMVLRITAEDHPQRSGPLKTVAERCQR
jgi:release factor glutamine methyltransferase